MSGITIDNKLLLFRFAITYVLALLPAPVTTQTLEEGCLHVRSGQEGTLQTPRWVILSNPPVRRAGGQMKMPAGKGVQQISQQ